MKVVIIGQSIFAANVYSYLKEDGHEIVGVYTIPDSNGRPDPLAEVATQDGLRNIFKLSRWRIKGKVIPEVFETYKSLGAELNVLPYCSQFIPMEVIEHPKHQSIIYHPSLLPRHRGASSINWTLIEGDCKAGFSVFWADDGLDEGPILLQRECNIEPNDTVESLYNRFLFPEGVDGVREAVALIQDGKAPRIPQTTVGATYEPMLNKKELTVVPFEKLTGYQLHNFIRGMDKVPGATISLDGEDVKVFSSSLYSATNPPSGMPVTVKGMSRDGIITNHGLVLYGNDGQGVIVQKIQLSSGRMLSANKYGQDDSSEDIVLTEQEEKYQQEIELIWQSILRLQVIDRETDFFKSGAGSMDVTRLVEEVREKCGVDIENEDVYMATLFDDFVKTVVLKSRGFGSTPTLVFEPVTVKINEKMTVSFPNQLFINNQFIDSSDGEFLDIFNPTDESLICKVACASSDDVDKAVTAAKVAFEEGDWSRMNARDRGKLMYRLADLMEQHKEELAVIESIDSGAVYTLALKTHIGMSIETWRYFAGWCDKIQGSTIPINNARPNKNLSFTKKEPIGVCGLITPWNYPLMMVSWKSAACLAAGNTLVLKPAQVCPLTALKLAELSVQAGFPPGVFNVVPGTGRVTGQAIVDHPLVRKLGFTGSTPVGKQIMSSCGSSNLKKVSLELGGKSPLIIFSDTDLDKAVRNAMSGVFFNKGENCIAAGRLFVEEPIHDRFVRRVIQETKKISIGDPLDRTTSHGYVIFSLLDHERKLLKNGH